MPKKTNENNIDIKNKLEYLGLNLNRIPKEFKEYENLDFRPSRNINEGLYKVYKYVPINKIELLLTPSDRMDTLYDKYSKASAIYDYLVPDTESNIIKHTTFLKMVSEINIDKIEKIEQEQKMFEKNIPFKVNYGDNYLWQIFYSEDTDKYFMLVPTKEQDNSAFFYILKKQIESKRRKKVDSIFVPIGNLEYSRSILSKDEAADIEKYMWLFTKDYPSIYEVYDKKDIPSIHIVGNTIVYEKINSFYKFKLNDKEELSKFYKLLKALFILQTELPHYYNFEVKISSNGGLDFLYNTKVVNYDNLSKMIKEEYEGAIENIRILNKDSQNKEEQLKILKTLAFQKDAEYMQKEKQIATFLNCRKSFLGRVRYFFRGRSKNKINDNVNIQNKEVQNETLKSDNVENVDTENIAIQEYYTIEDLLNVLKKLDKLDSSVKSMALDIDALKRKVELMNTKITNADIYIKEIEDHKKSIFEFWKFANKDNNLSLNPGNPDENLENNVILKKTFDYELDFEDFGIKIDKLQREELGKDTLDALYLMDSDDILKDINSIKLSANKDLEDSLFNLKQEAMADEFLFNTEEFDIFGGRAADKTRISILDNKKHREAHKNKYRILDINKNTLVQEYQEKLVEILKKLNDDYGKIKLDIDLPIFMASSGSINGKEFGLFNINPENALEKETVSNKINLYRINLKDGMSIFAFSNIVFYDNYNKTLPTGMNVSDEILIDMNEFSFELKRQKLFRVNQEINNIDVETKIICVYEYDVEEVN